MRNEDIYIVEVDDFEFNGMIFTEIHIPINHINYDKNNNKRSDWTVEKITTIVFSILNGLYLEMEGERDNEKYFALVAFYELKPYKLVFSIIDGEIFVKVLTMFKVSKK